MPSIALQPAPHRWPVLRRRTPGVALALLLSACLDGRSPHPPPRVPKPKVEATTCTIATAAQEPACTAQP